MINWPGSWYQNKTFQIMKNAQEIIKPIISDRHLLSGCFKLSTLLGMSIAGIIVIITIATATAFFSVYDERLTYEFKERVFSESEEISQKIKNKLQSIQQQLHLLALDNSVRVNLMLDVDNQLLEKLKARYDKSQNIVHFIIKEEKSEIINFSHLPNSENLIKKFLALKHRDGLFYREQNNNIYVGFTTPIIHRDKRLGSAGSIFHFQPTQFYSKSINGGARLLFKETEKSIFDIKYKRPITLIRTESEKQAVTRLDEVLVDGSMGYLVELGNLPEFLYFMPRTKLDEARKEGIFSVIILAIIGVLTGILLAVWLSQKISRPLGSLIVDFNNIATASGTRQINRKSHINELNEFSEALIHIVDNLKKAEQEVTQSHENLKYILDNMDSLISISNVNTSETLFINHYGFKTLENLGDAKLLQRLAEYLINNTTYRSEEQADVQASLSRMKTYDIYDKQSQHWFEYQTRIIPWIDETTVRMTVINDITSRKLAENELRLSAAVFDTAKEALMITNPQNHILKVNRAFCDITGFTESEILGESGLILDSDRKDETTYNELTSTLKEQGHWEGEILKRKKNGQVFPVWISITTVYDSTGNTEYYAALFADITQRKSDEEKIRHQANYDSLTGLPNRTLFIDRFHSAIERANREQSRIALMFIDLDQFKHVNDTLGHPAGDQLLQLASHRLSETVRSSDTVARLGGDEFTVLMPDLRELHHVNNAVRNILLIIAEPYHINNNKVFVSASIGVTIFPDDATTVDALLRNADSAMYRAKEQGRNNAQYFTLELNLRAKRRLLLETALRHAIENNELEVYYQPILDALTGKIVSSEALLRWHSQEHGVISPLEFIPLAEDSGLIVLIGKWVLETACHTAVNWTKKNKRPLRIAVNLSIRQFQRDDVPLLIKSVLSKTGLPPDQLTVEITENLLLRDDKKTLDTLHDIREMGVAIAIDDFGTGYSSLSYLKRFPVTTIKIDRSFIDGLPTDSEDVALVEAILSLSKSLDLKVIAEGVENEQQYQFLRERDCAMVQGFYFSRPVPEQEFLNYSSDR